MTRHSALITLAFLTGLTTTATAQDVGILRGDMEASDLIDRWAKATNRIPVIDPHVFKIRLRFPDGGKLDVKTLRHLLDLHDVVVTEHGKLLVAHHRRNLAQKEGPPWKPVVTGRLPLPTEHKLVTYVARIRHGAGNSIFATLRGLLTRDTNRVGNILYVQGPETLIVVDFAHKVRYYRDLIRLLDQPPATPRIDATVFEVPRATWQTLRKANKDAALHGALKKAVASKQATLVEEADLTSLGSRFETLKRVRVEDEELELRLSSQKFSSKVGGKVSYLNLHYTLSRNRQTTVLRQFRVQIPEGFYRARTRVFSFTLREGATPSNLVLLIRGRETK